MTEQTTLTRQNPGNEVVSTNAEYYLEQFRSAIGDMAEALQRAAEIYVEAIDSGEVTHEDFRREFRFGGYDFWVKLEKVGRGWMDGRLLMAKGLKAEYTEKLRKLPKSEQTAALDNGVDVLASDGSALRVKVEDLTPRQAKQVFAREHIRTLAEQRAYLEDVASRKEIEPRPHQTYEIRKVNGTSTLIVHEPCRLTKRDLKKINKLME